MLRFSYVLALIAIFMVPIGFAQDVDFDSDCVVVDEVAAQIYSSVGDDDQLRKLKSKLNQISCDSKEAIIFYLRNVLDYHISDSKMVESPAYAVSSMMGDFGYNQAIPRHLAALNSFEQADCAQAERYIREDEQFYLDGTFEMLTEKANVCKNRKKACNQEYHQAVNELNAAISLFDDSAFISVDFIKEKLGDVDEAIKNCRNAFPILSKDLNLKKAQTLLDIPYIEIGGRSGIDIAQERLINLLDSSLEIEAAKTLFHLEITRNNCESAEQYLLQFLYEDVWLYGGGRDYTERSVVSGVDIETKLEALTQCKMRNSAAHRVSLGHDETFDSNKYNIMVVDIEQDNLTEFLRVADGMAQAFFDHAVEYESIKDSDLRFWSFSNESFAFIGEDMCAEEDLGTHIRCSCQQNSLIKIKELYSMDSLVVTGNNNCTSMARKGSNTIFATMRDLDTPIDYVYSNSVPRDVTWDDLHYWHSHLLMHELMHSAFELEDEYSSEIPEGPDETSFDKPDVMPHNCLWGGDDWKNRNLTENPPTDWDEFKYRNHLYPEGFKLTYEWGCGYQDNLIRASEFSLMTGSYPDIRKDMWRRDDGSFYPHILGPYNDFLVSARLQKFSERDVREVDGEVLFVRIDIERGVGEVVDRDYFNGRIASDVDSSHTVQVIDFFGDVVFENKVLLYERDMLADVDSAVDLGVLNTFIVPVTPTSSRVEVSDGSDIIEIDVSVGYCGDGVCQDGLNSLSCPSDCESSVHGVFGEARLERGVMFGNLTLSRGACEGVGCVSAPVMEDYVEFNLDGDQVRLTDLYKQIRFKGSDFFAEVDSDLYNLRVSDDEVRVRGLFEFSDVVLQGDCEMRVGGGGFARSC